MVKKKKGALIHRYFFEKQRRNCPLGIEAQGLGLERDILSYVLYTGINRGFEGSYIELGEKKFTPLSLYYIIIKRKKISLFVCLLILERGGRGREKSLAGSTPSM